MNPVRGFVLISPGKGVLLTETIELIKRVLQYNMGKPFSSWVKQLYYYSICKQSRTVNDVSNRKWPGTKCITCIRFKLCTFTSTVYIYGLIMLVNINHVILNDLIDPFFMNLLKANKNRNKEGWIDNRCRVKQYRLQQ